MILAASNGRDLCSEDRVVHRNTDIRCRMPGMMGWSWMQPFWQLPNRERFVYYIWMWSSKHFTLFQVWRPCGSINVLLTELHSSSLFFSLISLDWPNSLNSCRKMKRLLFSLWRKLKLVVCIIHKNVCKFKHVLNSFFFITSNCIFYAQI